MVSRRGVDTAGGAEVKPYRGPQMTFGNAAARRVRLIASSGAKFSSTRAQVTTAAQAAADITLAGAGARPAMPGMLRKSRAFVARYQRFESTSLLRRVLCELD